MRNRTVRWLAGALLVLVLALGLALGGIRPPVAHGGGPTPTPAQSAGGEPGGSGGGGG